MDPNATKDRAADASTEPAAPRLRLVEPPETEPDTSAPADLGRARSSRPGSRPVPVQGTLALLFTVPGGAPALPAPSRALRLVTRSAADPVDPDDPAHEDSVDRDLPQTPRSELPDPRRWTARLVQAAVEARLGDRPVAQLSRWTTRELYDRLARDVVPTRSDVVARRRTVRPVVRTLHLTEPADGVVEACAVVHDGRRGRAVALRLEGLDGRWLCTSLEII